MKIKVEIDTDRPHYETIITVDGRRLGGVQNLSMNIDMDKGLINMSRLILGYGGRFRNRSDIRLSSTNSKWVMV